MTMANQYELVGDETVAEVEQLLIPRAKALGEAVSHHHDFKLVECRRILKDGKVSDEIIIVDVKCEGVPPNSPFGIEYQERLALKISVTPQHLVEVLAMRKSFPLLMHQNWTPPNSPRSLCLYYESPRSVSRTWTPQSFLRRVQYWLEKSAVGTLHPEDQPVEHLFFTARFAVVLPWNFDENRANTNKHLSVDRVVSHANASLTCTFKWTDNSAQGLIGDVAPVMINLPSIVHGQLMHDPANLGGLANLLSARGIDLHSALTEKLRQLVPDGGLAVTTSSQMTVLILSTPVIREAGGAAEMISYRAFWLKQGLLQLGEAVGCLFRHKGMYYKEQPSGILAPKPKDDWRTITLDGAEVAQELDAKSARKFSGIADSGPNGVLVGAGALGSTMLELWTRSGWGAWTVIDNDHIKPHNLARHPAIRDDIGRAKIDVARSLGERALGGATTIRGIEADACDFNESVVSAMVQAELAVDITTTIEYPREASIRTDLCRHASVFLTPRGNDSVLLMEDSERNTTLRTLEAQYYRAILNYEWGANHLDGNLGKLRSGAGCRDVSMVMPYTRIMAHGAILAEQVQRCGAEPSAAIKVWVQDVSNGVATVHDMPVHQERSYDIGGLAVSIDEGIIEKMAKFRAANLPRETGGIVLGYVDFNIASIVVVDVLPAPIDSVSSEVTFQRGVDSTNEVIAEVARRTANIVGYIGEWHSHPTGAGANPSSLDMKQLLYLTEGMAADGLPVVSIIIGEDNDLTFMMGQGK